MPLPCYRPLRCHSFSSKKVSLYFLILPGGCL
jgi:hypothetical protein